MKQRICTINAVRQYDGDGPPELWIDDEGRPIVVARTEAGHVAVELDARDLLRWLSADLRAALTSSLGPARTAELLEANL